jgi:hypothetical protein
MVRFSVARFRRALRARKPGLTTGVGYSHETTTTDEMTLADAVRQRAIDLHSLDAGLPIPMHAERMRIGGVDITLVSDWLEANRHRDVGLLRPGERVPELRWLR